VCVSVCVVYAFVCLSVVSVFVCVCGVVMCLGGVCSMYVFLCMVSCPQSLPASESFPMSQLLNQIPCYYTVEVRNRFKGLDTINRVPDEVAFQSYAKSGRSS